MYASLTNIPAELNHALESNKRSRCIDGRYFQGNPSHRSRDGDVHPRPRHCPYSAFWTTTGGADVWPP